MARKVRWGHLPEIQHVKRIFDGRAKKAVQSAEFSTLPRRLKNLCTHRRSHMFGGHNVPHKHAGTIPRTGGSAAGMDLRQRLNLVARLEGKH